MEYEEIIKNQINDSIDAKKALIKSSIPTIKAIADEMIFAYNSGKKVLWCGNGGSAADAQHLACELVSKFYLERRALPSLALTTNTSILTAIGNDYGFERIFARQVEAVGQPKDVLVGISTSGNSRDVIAAMEQAKSMGLRTIAFTGRLGGKLKGIVDICLCVPSDDTPRIQEGHITVGHIICYLVEQELFGKSVKTPMKVA